MDAQFIPLQLSWQPNAFCPLRVALVASRRVAVVVRTERRLRHINLVAFSVRYALNTWRVVQGLARRLRRHSHCKPSWAKPNRKRDVTRVIRRKRRSVLTTTATRRDATRATRRGQNGLGCQDSWRGMKGAWVELRTTQAVRFGSVLFGSACSVNDAEGVWPIPARHVMYLMRTWPRTRRDESDRRKRRSDLTTTATQRDRKQLCD